MSTPQSFHNHTRRTHPHNYSLSIELIQRVLHFRMMGEVGDLDPNKFPLACRGMSRLWRAAIDDMKEIWSHIIIRPVQFRVGADKAIKDWLDRAGGRRLAIIAAAPPEVDCDILQNILMAIGSRSTQLQVLNFDISHRSLDILLGNPATPLTFLRTLALSVKSQPMFKMDPSAMALRRLHINLDRKLAILRTDVWKLPWSQLTHIYLHTTGTIGSVWGLIVTCTNLDTLEITAPRDIAVPYIPYHPLDPLISNMRRLSLTVYTRSNVIGFFLDALQLPLLEEFKIIFLPIIYDRNIWLKDEILSLRDRSVAPLRDVVINGKYIFHDDLLDFVKKVPTLERLRAVGQGQDFVDPAIKALLPQTGADVRQRRLAYLDELTRAREEGRI